MTQNQSSFLDNLKDDLPASIAVFLVALPLCLGIALASGAPMFSGLIAGIVGGIVIGALSGSALSVSGPAAGLTTIVLSAITSLGSYSTFLCAAVVAGVLQLLLGVFRAGALGKLFPHAVIKGMLSAIGLILIMKQLPHALGYEPHDGSGFLASIEPGALLIGATSLLVLIVWDHFPATQRGLLKFIPGSLIVVALGVTANAVLMAVAPEWAIGASQRVSIASAGGINEFLGQVAHPDFTQLRNPQVYVTAITLALVASIESLLSIEASDKLDPQRRKTPLNRELFAQGTGNIVSGLLGGLPVTAVIVRSSANVNSGARSKSSAIAHGLWLLLAVVFIPTVLNLIPLASLAAVLLTVGYKLTKPVLYKQMFSEGYTAFVPFVVTIGSILATNLLVGIFIGMATSFAMTFRVGEGLASLRPKQGE